MGYNLDINTINIYTKFTVLNHLSMASDQAIFTISTAAMLLELHPRTLMLYERSKLISPYRTATNRRMFSLNDLEQLQFIKFLTRNKGVNLSGVKAIMDAIDSATEDGVKLKVKLYPDFEVKQLV